MILTKDSFLFRVYENSLSKKNRGVPLLPLMEFINEWGLPRSLLITYIFFIIINNHIRRFFNRFIRYIDHKTADAIGNLFKIS